MTLRLSGTGLPTSTLVAASKMAGRAPAPTPQVKNPGLVSESWAPRGLKRLTGEVLDAAPPTAKGAELGCDQTPSPLHTRPPGAQVTPRHLCSFTSRSPTVHLSLRSPRPRAVSERTRPPAPAGPLPNRGNSLGDGRSQGRPAGLPALSKVQEGSHLCAPLRADANLQGGDSQPPIPPTRGQAVPL